METAIKISQILTPVVLAIAGYFISRNLARQAHSNVVSSDFNTRWVTLFMDKAIIFNGLVTQTIAGFHWLSSHPLEENTMTPDLNTVIRKLHNAEYDFRVHAELVDGTDKIKETVSSIYSKIAKILKDKNGNTNEVEALQKSLNKQQKEIHKFVVNLKK